MGRILKVSLIFIVIGVSWCFEEHPAQNPYEEDTSTNRDVSDCYKELGEKCDDTESVEDDIDGKDDVVSKFLRIVETQQKLGESCVAGTHLSLGEGVVDRYAQERFRTEAEVAVNKANMLTRLWKYSAPVLRQSEYILHANVLSMVEFNENIFAAGNCYDLNEYSEHTLYCPYAYRLPDGKILVKDLAVEYKYLDSASEWFYIARLKARQIVSANISYSQGYHTYTWNETSHTARESDVILSVQYENGRWSKPYYDCGGGNIWMMTYTVPFFGYTNSTYYFKGTSGIDIDLRRVDIDQCPQTNDHSMNIFAASDKCKNATTYCISVKGLGFRRGSYKCACKKGYYFPFGNESNSENYYSGVLVEQEYEKLILGKSNTYNVSGSFECVACAEGCDECADGSPCMVQLNWWLRTLFLIISCCVIISLLFVLYFTRLYRNVRVVKAASPVLLQVIIFGAFLIYCTTIVTYVEPTNVTCVARNWLREIGFALTYGALMLKTWRISVIFEVRSAKAIKITDANLLKKLSLIVAGFGVFLTLRTIVEPPRALIATTKDNLKAYVCATDWWDNWFSLLEALFLVWGIRLCLSLKQAPSEFNERKFISIAIYNEFILSIFLNVYMWFLNSTANPDLMYIICFGHAHLTITQLLCLIFGSKAYMIFKGKHQDEVSVVMVRLPTNNNFIVRKRKPQNGHSTSSLTTSAANFQELPKITEQDVQMELEAISGNLNRMSEMVKKSDGSALYCKLKTAAEYIENIRNRVDIGNKNGNRNDNGNDIFEIRSAVNGRANSLDMCAHARAIENDKPTVISNRLSE